MCNIKKSLFQPFLKRYESKKTKLIVFLKENFKQNIPMSTDDLMRNDYILYI